MQLNSIRDYIISQSLDGDYSVFIESMPPISQILKSICLYYGAGQLPIEQFCGNGSARAGLTILIQTLKKNYADLESRCFALIEGLNQATINDITFFSNSSNPIKVLSDENEAVRYSVNFRSTNVGGF